MNNSEDLQLQFIVIFNGTWVCVPNLIVINPIFGETLTNNNLNLMRLKK